MKKEIELLQQCMKDDSIDLWICPISDPHQSEYIGEYYKSVKYLSGFSGSAATLVVCSDGAYLWTDGRYFVQADKQLAGSGIFLMKQGEKGVENINEFILRNIKENKVKTIGLNGELFSYNYVNELKNNINKYGVNLISDKELINSVWTDRPKLKHNKIKKLGMEYTGEECISKLNRIRARFNDEFDACVINSLNDINWILNYRGSDISYNTSFFSFLYIDREKAVLFLGDDAYDEDIASDLSKSGVEIKKYDDRYEFLKGIKCLNIGLDIDDTNYITVSLLEENNKIGKLIISDMKNIKNDIEISSMKEAHVRDGVYLTRFIKWLKDEFYYKSGHHNNIDEYDAAKKIDSMRAEDEKFIDLSFDSISAYGPNAAMPHYSAKKDSAAKLENKGLYLIDSGAHYLDGTTDVTRTVALGQISDEERVHYTLTVISMLRLLNLRFKEGTYGNQIDIIAREKLWEYGIDYNHGTGHGVGFCNGVHEGPVSISRKLITDKDKNLALTKGIVVSDEPGVYIENSHGIRMEILVYCKKSDIEGFYEFEALTLAPIDKDAMDFSILNEKEKYYYNNYQSKVYDKLSKYLNADEAKWLKEQTKNI